VKPFKSILLVLILVVLLLPVIQGRLGLVNVQPLDGDVTLARDTSASVEGWFSSGYQDIKEKFLNDNFGFRNFYVRLRNHASYLLFNKVYARDVVAGRSGFLYERKYLQTHAGEDFIGQEQVAGLFEKIRFIQDTLEKKGITFALLFAPGKASFYPEYIPAPYDVKPAATNYAAFSAEARRRQVNHIDFNGWFAAMKEKSPYPLYPKTGTHWSIYGMHVAFDSLARYMQWKGGRGMRQFDYSQVELSDSMRHPDGDIAAGLNLLCELPHFTMAYPQVAWKDTSGKWRPRVLTVADSYWMGVYFTGLPETVFREHEFWYYNKMLYKYDPAGQTFDATDYDLKTSVEKNDFIFVMATEASLRHLGWGLVDELYHLYKDGSTAYLVARKYRKKNNEIARIERNIWSDEKWLPQVKKQAKQLNIAVDSCVRMNAVYFYNDAHKNDPQPTFDETFRERVLLARAQIEQNKEWYRYVVNKARSLNLTVDSCLNMDAHWVARQGLLKERTEYFKQQIHASADWFKTVKAQAEQLTISVDSSVNMNARYMAEQELKDK
jgi:hypothetical protein